jgi:rubrerythrin
MIRREVEMMEDEARNFYQAAIAQTSDAGVRQLLGDLASEESRHYDLAEQMDEKQSLRRKQQGKRVRAPPVRPPTEERV